MGGGMCIIGGYRVVAIAGSGDVDAVALFSEPGGFARFFIRYYNLNVEWAKKRPQISLSQF
jgi:hypothetical protein